MFSLKLYGKGFRFHIIVITLKAQSMRRLDLQSGASRIK